MKKICPHCNKEFKSNHARRIYCSDSHRVSAYNKKKGFKIVIVPPFESSKPVIENKGLSGINNNESDLKEPKSQFGSQLGASVLGNLGTKLLINAFTKEENKPATKKDLINVFKILQKDQVKIYNLLQKILINNQKELMEEIKNNKDILR